MEEFIPRVDLLRERIKPEVCIYLSLSIYIYIERERIEYVTIIYV